MKQQNLSSVETQLVTEFDSHASMLKESCTTRSSTLVVDFALTLASSLFGIFSVSLTVSIPNSIICVWNQTLWCCKSRFKNHLFDFDMSVIVGLGTASMKKENAVWNCFAVQRFEVTRRNVLARVKRRRKRAHFFHLKKRELPLLLHLLASNNSIPFF